jgi:hypothetical protein
MFGARQDKVLDRALFELEGDPAHGVVKAHLVEEVARTSSRPSELCVP